MEQISRTIRPEDVGQRLDQFLVELDDHVSRAEVQRQIRDGLVLIAGRGRPAILRVRIGEWLSWNCGQIQALSPRPLPLHIVYEDEDLVLRGQASRPHRPSRRRDARRTTLVEACSQRASFRRPTIP